MDLKSSLTTTLFLLLLLLFTSPYYANARGGSVMVDPDVYEIDYRGPETHSSVPPPDHSRHGKHWIPKESGVVSPKSNALKGGKIGANEKEIHG